MPSGNAQTAQATRDHSRAMVNDDFDLTDATNALFQPVAIGRSIASSWVRVFGPV
jgi:hypothetical protein